MFGPFLSFHEKIIINKNCQNFQSITPNCWRNRNYFIVGVGCLWRENFGKNGRKRWMKGGKFGITITVIEQSQLGKWTCCVGGVWVCVNWIWGPKEGNAIGRDEANNKGVRGGEGQRHCLRVILKHAFDQEQTWFLICYTINIYVYICMYVMLTQVYIP